MIKQLLFCFLFLQSVLLMAHQTDLSTTMLVERENNNWILQIRAALTAFEYEVETIYGANAYDSPEKFMELVLEYMNENLSVTFNENKVGKLQNGFVKLGHESNVIFELLNVPSEIKTIKVSNSSFKDIFNNQSALVIFKDGFEREQFILDNDNEHTASLVAKTNTFELIEKQPKSYLRLFVIVLSVIAITIVLLFAIQKIL